jgi:hypothetical protein
LYNKYFCVYFDEIRNENLIEAKRINPKYKWTNIHKIYKD